MKRSLAGTMALLSAVAVVAAGCSAEGAEAGSAATESAAVVQAAPQLDELHARFVGNWELVSYVSFPENGPVVDNNYIGRILYDANGNMSAIGMPRTLPARATTAAAGENPRAGFAYFSTWELFPEESRIEHHVIGSPMNASWPGTDLIRFYDFTPEGLLNLSIRNEAGRVTGTLTWRKLTAPATDQVVK
jgi:hypothetical protein